MKHDELLCLNLYSNLVTGKADDSTGDAAPAAAPAAAVVAMPVSTRVLTPEMKKWTGNAVRKSFVDYMVEKQKHTFWPSSPVSAACTPVPPS